MSLCDSNDLHAPNIYSRTSACRSIFSTPLNILCYENYLNFNNSIWMSFIFVCHFYIGTILGKMTLQRLFYLFATVSDWKHSLRFFASASRKTTATTTKIFHWFDPFALFLSFVAPSNCTFIFYCLCPRFILPLHLARSSIARTHSHIQPRAMQSKRCTGRERERKKRIFFRGKRL